MTTKAAKRPLRSLSAHEKMEAIKRVHKGESKAAVARDIGVPESTLRGWCKNEDKIQYLSRQSTPDTDDSEPREKRHRYEPAPIEPVVVHQPYNLSVRTDDPGSYSPTLTTVEVARDSTPLSSRVPTLEPGALNLSKQDSPKDNNSSLSEREKNRAELTRLSIELGLNRPEMFLPNANIAANLSDLSASFTANLGLVAQWNNALLQQVGTKSNAKSNASTPTSTGGVPQPSATQKTSKAKKEQRQQQQQQQQQLPPADGSVDDSVWYWLKTQQAMLGLVQQNSNQNTVDPNSSWFWKWYKQIAYGQQPPQTAEKPILYQQLTKDANAENIKTDEDLSQPKPTKVNTNNTKARAVLDNLLLNNNNNNNNNEVTCDNVGAANDDVSVSKKDVKDDTPSSPAEALEYGEKFLRWLERCGDPSVTAVQILQFRYLLNNVKSSANRKNGTTEHKTKVRSRK